MPKSSPIDAHVALLGVKSDAAVAKLAGVSVAAVYQYRRYRGIVVSTRPHAVAALQKELSPAKAKPTKASVAMAGSGDAKKPRTSKLDAFLDMVGVLPDAEVARRAGVTREAVRQYRLKRTRRTTSGSTAPSAAPPAPSAAPTHAAASATRAPSKTVGELMCWRVTKSDGSITHLAAISAEHAATRAHAALGDQAVSVALLGEVYP